VCTDAQATHRTHVIVDTVTDVSVNHLEFFLAPDVQTVATSAYHPTGPFVNQSASQLFPDGIYTISASSIYNAIGESYHAVDGNQDSYLNSHNQYNTAGNYTGTDSTVVDGLSMLGEWIQLDMPVMVTVNNIKILPIQLQRYHINLSPRDMAIAAWVDNQWTLVSQHSTICTWSKETRYFQFTTAVTTSKTRMKFKKVTRGQPFGVSLAEFKLQNVVEDSARTPTSVRFYAGASDPSALSFQTELDLSGLPVPVGQRHSFVLPPITLRYYKLEFVGTSIDFIRVPSVRLKFAFGSTITLPIPRTMSRYWKFDLGPAFNTIGLHEIRMQTNTPLGPNQSYLENGFRVTELPSVKLIKAYAPIQPRPSPVMLLDGASSGTLINSPDGTLHHTHQVTDGVDCRATPGDLIVNHVMGGLSDLRLVVDGKGTHGFTATMGFDAGMDLQPPAPNRTNLFIDAQSGTYLGALPHHSARAIEVYSASAVPTEPTPHDILLLKMTSGLEAFIHQNRPDGDLEHTNTLCELPLDPENGVYSMKAWNGDLVRSEAFPGFNELRLEVTDPQGNPATVSSLVATLGVA
jgi:hypothetical protein